jgi:hypothetical protein
MTRFGKALCLLSSVALWQGCSSSSDSDASADGSVIDTGSVSDAPSDAFQGFLSRGSNFYKVTGVVVAPGEDGCGTMASTLADMGGFVFPVTYVEVGQVLSVGRPVGSPPQPSLGTGAPIGVTGTLNRANDVTDGACSWHQTDVSIFTLTGGDIFTLDVTENQSAFTAGCGTPVPPACMSTFTLALAKTTPPADAGTGG